MAHWRSMTDRETLGAWDLVGKDGKPKDFRVLIESVTPGLIKSKEKPRGERRPFIYFKGSKKPLVCNATNAETISAMAGSEDTDRWVGLVITMYSTQVKSKGGKPVPGIRIRPMRGTGAAEEIGEGQPVDDAIRNQQEEASGGEEVEHGNA